MFIREYFCKFHVLIHKNLITYYGHTLIIINFMNSITTTKISQYISVFMPLLFFILMMKGGSVASNV